MKKSFTKQVKRLLSTFLKGHIRPGIFSNIAFFNVPAHSNAARVFTRLIPGHKCNQIFSQPVKINGSYSRLTSVASNA